MADFQASVGSTSSDRHGRLRGQKALPLPPARLTKRHEFPRDRRFTVFWVKKERLSRQRDANRFKEPEVSAPVATSSVGELASRSSKESEARPVECLAMLGYTESFLVLNLLASVRVSFNQT